MDNIKSLRLEPRPTSPVAKMLAEAAGAKLQMAFVGGWDEQGQLYFESSETDGAEILWVLEQIKFALLEGGRE
jgi:hypothetical protein